MLSSGGSPAVDSARHDLTMCAQVAQLAGEGYSGAWARGDRGEAVAVVVVPTAQIAGLSGEMRHSLGLEPTSCVAIKLRQVRGSMGRLLPDNDRRGELAVWKFTVRRLQGSSASLVIEEQLDAFLLAGPSDDAAPPNPSADFGVRYSLENILQRYFLPMLAVEQADWCSQRGLPPVDPALSFAYTRCLVNQGVDIASAKYFSGTLRRQRDEALSAAQGELESRAKQLRRPPPKENQLLRLAHFVKQQIERSAEVCLVCSEPMSTNNGLKPFVCGKALCVHQYTELNLARRS